MGSTVPARYGLHPAMPWAWPWMLQPCQKKPIHNQVHSSLKKMHTRRVLAVHVTKQTPQTVHPRPPLNRSIFKLQITNLSHYPTLQSWPTSLEDYQPGTTFSSLKRSFCFLVLLHSHKQLTGSDLPKDLVLREKIWPQYFTNNNKKCLNCKHLSENTPWLAQPSGWIGSLNWPWMLWQILEALVRPWENFFPVRDKTQAVVLAELQPQLGSSAPLAPQPESDLWTYDSSCSASQPRGDLPTGFWSSWTPCWMTDTTELLLDLSATSNSTRAHIHLTLPCPSLLLCSYSLQ